ncbi:Tfp pilus assembly protein FimT/FimU [Alkalihalobacillus sp. AL-G]|uniref:pilus assembly FimT family protein n=1 Tax=Alkalihalobacillus sp. AL-G TaxID=2926399 RepID=UPI00272B4215|nr:hypothetical protein [Alkalihalobacillus sp. AL-G]WLD92254.1 FapA family protein [Alkalihalobacillus sp. AL-G]
MVKFVKSNKGSTLIIVLMVIMVLGIFAPIGYTWFSKLSANENRLIYQKQAVNLSVSAMETFQRQENAEKVTYLSDYTYPPNRPNTIQSGTSVLDLYQYALDENQSPMNSSDLQSYSGEYTVVVHAISGDFDHDASKDSNEDFFYEHKMTAKESTLNSSSGEVVIELENGETIEMAFEEFLDQHDSENPAPGDLTINGVGEDGEYSTKDRIEIAATGSVTINGNFIIESGANGEGKMDLNNIEVISETGDIVVNQGTLISTGNSSSRDIILEAPQGNIFVNGSTLEARREIRLYAGMSRNGSLITPNKNIVLESAHFETKKNAQIIFKASGEVIEN